MWTRSVAAFVLVSSIVTACGSRSDLLGLPGIAPREGGADPESRPVEAGGATPEASAPVDAGATADATATVGTCALVEAGAATQEEPDGAACELPFQVLFEVASGACTALPAGGGCGSSGYQLTCDPGKMTQQVFDALGCTAGPGEPQKTGVACCPCGGPPARCPGED